MKLGHGWVTIPHMKSMIWLLIPALTVQVRVWMSTVLTRKRLYTEPDAGNLCLYKRLWRYSVSHGPFARYLKVRVAHAPGMQGTFSPPLRVSDPDMHHGTCVTHVPWCMPRSLTSGFLSIWWRGKRSQHSRRMRNPQFYVSGKRPMKCAHISFVICVVSVRLHQVVDSCEWSTHILQAWFTGTMVLMLLQRRSREATLTDMTNE